jgi:uncharacterized protein VirK/YbjX
MDYAALKIIGKSLYNTKVPKEMKRYLVFLGRCCLHKKEVENLQKFFAASQLRQQMLEATPSFVEQATRGFFYAGATWADRVAIVKHHIKYLEKTTKPAFLKEIYCQHKPIVLWQQEVLDKPLTMELFFHAGQRKEGCLSLMLNWDNNPFYQIMFWLGPGFDKENALWVGAMQGTSLGNDAVKVMTKQFFGYRTKNLIFYGIRNVAKVLGCQHIYAVTNEGYYAMNHLRLDRKLKTNFGTFWEECEGKLCTDKRFYQIPIEETRKEMSEMKPSKRANHRRRYELMDAITATIKEKMAPYLQE